MWNDLMSAAMDFLVFLTIIQIRPCQQYGYSMFLFFGRHWGAVQSTSQNVEDELKSCALFDFWSMPDWNAMDAPAFFAGTFRTP